MCFLFLHDFLVHPCKYLASYTQHMHRNAFRSSCWVHFCCPLLTKFEMLYTRENLEKPYSLLLDKNQADMSCFLVVGGCWAGVVRTVQGSYRLKKNFKILRSWGNTQVTVCLNTTDFLCKHLHAVIYSPHTKTLLIYRQKFSSLSGAGNVNILTLGDER